MARQTFPDNTIFANSAPEITQPEASRWATGYESGSGKTPPSAGVHNYEFNRGDQMLQHIERNGVPVWDARTIYPLHGWALGSDGMLYRSRLNGNSGNNPVGGDGTYWRSARSIFNEGVYEVGSVLIRPTDPGLPEASGGLGFGSWTKIQGRGLRGTGSVTDNNGYSREFSFGQSGGNFKNTLSVDQMPRHRHTGTTSSDTHSHGTDWPMGAEGDSSNWMTQGDSGRYDGQFTRNTESDTHSHSFTTSYEGEGEQFDIVDPYYAVDIWRRTA